jgi:hypothetical protein
MSTNESLQALVDDYYENNNEDEDFDVEAYQEYLESLPEEELEELYNDRFS